MRHFSMKKWDRLVVVMVALVTGLVLGISGGAALAATISNLSGQSCGDGCGTWHFVNNQTGTTVPGTLSAEWDEGANTCLVGPSAVNNNVQHFYCDACGTLTSASTNLQGRLVLSDFDCEDVKCVPEKEICGDGVDNDCDGQIDEGCGKF